MDHPHAQLHEMNPVGRFDDRATDYVKYRPTYPAASIDAVLAGLPPATALVGADIGAGTGISARLLAQRGVRVLAIEPNGAMRAAAEPHPLVEWRAGMAEATGLDDASVDLVLCAQSFHWFRQRDALREFHRILKPGGRLALVWNHRDRADSLTLGYVVAIHAVNGEHPAEQRELDRAVVHQDGWFTPACLETFPNEQSLDGPGLLGRAASASYVPKDGPSFEVLRRNLELLFERHRGEDGLVRLRYETRVYLAERIDCQSQR
jgi:SAM-dependent methyltransferase